MRASTLLALLLLAAGAVRADDALPGQARALAEAHVAARKSVGLVVGIVRPDGRVETVAAGRSGNEARPAIDARTIFEIGSITKTFTATLLAQRVERGELRLDTPVREAAPKARDWKRPGVGDATLGSLASHTSGLPRLPYDWRLIQAAIFSREDPYAAYSAERFLDYAATAGSPGPGPHPVSYSNYGAALLGEVLARREGATWEALVRRDILLPLGLARTASGTAKADEALLARGHTDDLKPAPYWSIPGMAGAGALRSNVEDLATYLVAHRDGTLAGARLTQARQAARDENLAVGLGWLIRPLGSSRVLFHNGGTGGFRSFAGWHEGSKVGVIVLSNSETGVDEIGFRLLGFPPKP